MVYGKENIGKYWGKYVEIILKDKSVIKGFVTVFDSRKITKNKEDTLYLENREFEDFIKPVYASKIDSIKEIKQEDFYNEIESKAGFKKQTFDRDELEWDLIVGMSAKKFVMQDYVGKYVRVHCLESGVLSGYIEKYDENYIDFTKDVEEQIAEPVLIMNLLNGDKVVLEKWSIDAIVVINKEQVNDAREFYLRNMC
jgi:hypothetical protein